MILIASLILPIGVYAANQTANQRSIATSGGYRNVTWVEITLDMSYVVMGLSAQETLGQPTATLEQFAIAMADVAGTNTVIFPVNYFYAYGGPHANEIIGGIVSEGQLVHHSYFSQGAGFTLANQFGLFSGEWGSLGLQTMTWPNQPLDFHTAFNVYPQLIQDGERIPIAAMPGATLQWQENLVMRAFMGQRADGTFIVGNVPGSSILQVQDIAVYLGLVNATNIDGGASAGIWHNGSIITRPGRQLASVAFITNNRTYTPILAAPTASPVLVDGENTDFAAFNIDGHNFFMLRDIAYVLSGTASQFEVLWDGELNAINLVTGQAYSPAGGEMAPSAGRTATANPTTAEIFVDGEAVDLRAYNIGGNNFFMLRDLGAALGFGVDWDGEAGTILIDTR
jgi:hypothetical protein